MSSFNIPLYQPDKGFRTDPTIKDHHLGQVVRELPYTKDVEEVYRRAAILAAKDES